jgi:hypothetical protein
MQLLSCRVGSTSKMSGCRRLKACRYQLRHQLCREGCTAGGLVDTLCGRRIVSQHGGGTTRATEQFTAAIGALSSQDAFCTGSTEGAFERANACGRGLRRQICVAAFTIGSELKHENSSLYGEPLALTLRGVENLRGRVTHATRTVGVVRLQWVSPIFSFTGSVSGFGCVSFDSSTLPCAMVHTSGCS